MQTIRWEDRQEVRTNPKLVEDFKRAYADPTLTLVLIGGNFGMAPSSTHEVAKRLGMCVRPIKDYKRLPKAPVTTINTLTEEIERKRNELASLEQKKLDMTIRAERIGNNIIAHGLGEQVAFPVECWVTWLKAGGPQKVRQLIKEDEWTF